MLSVPKFAVVMYVEGSPAVGMAMLIGFVRGVLGTLAVAVALVVLAMVL